MGTELAGGRYRGRTGAARRCGGRRLPGASRPQTGHAGHERALGHLRHPHAVSGAEAAGAIGLVRSPDGGANDMSTRRLGLIMNGVTGRMGMNQHLVRSIIAIRDQGGVKLSNGDRVMPDPILIGRNAGKVEQLAKEFNIARFTADLDKALSDKNDTVFFDAATTQARPSLLTRAINAGKHVYCEKPIATTFEEALDVVKLAGSKGVKHGTVQDKLFLPGLKKLAFLRDSGFFRCMVSVRGEFGYWVFEGDWQGARRPSG